MTNTLYLSILFHRMHLDFIFSALHMSGYGNKFINNIAKVGYTYIQSEIKINGLN